MSTDRECIECGCDLLDPGPRCLPCELALDAPAELVAAEQLVRELLGAEPW